MDLVGAFEFLSTKVGLVVVILGVMHFFNMRMLVRYRTSRLFKVLTPAEDLSIRSRALGAR